MNSSTHLPLSMSLPVFALVSTLVHGLALYVAMDSSAPDLLAANRAIPTISIQLVATHTSTKANAAGEQSAPTDENEKSRTSPTISQQTTSQLQDMIIARIKGQLIRHFYYPALARRQGWQGRVLLDFSVSDNGHINDIQIKLSSGYPILDRAAVTALDAVTIDNMPNTKSIQLALSRRLSLPVVYRFIERPRQNINNNTADNSSHRL